MQPKLEMTGRPDDANVSDPMGAVPGALAAGGSAIALLKNEHLVIKQLLSMLADSSNATQQTNTLDQLKLILTIHNATEENLVYPAIREVAGAGSDADELYHEQDEAKVLVWKIDTGLKTGADVSATAAQLRDAVFAHIAKEEGTDFPKLEQSASAAQTRMLNASVGEFRNTLGVQAVVQR